MLNDAAKKLIAREARAQIKGYRERAALGANQDELCTEAWGSAMRSYPDFRVWVGAKEYFEAVFLNELDR